MRRTIKTVALVATGALAWTMTLADSSAQQVVTDEFGTEYLAEFLPTNTQRQVTETATSLELGGEGPLKVKPNGSFVLNPDSHGGVSSEPLVNSLRGIVVVPTPGDVRLDGWPGVEGIWHAMTISPKR
ncbi:MAG: hypothetical protein GXP30_11730 [Verrucomicrobia bacterium]|nr:hypothetical protein [Verrucomicrobiota bacterium]